MANEERLSLRKSEDLPGRQNQIGISGQWGVRIAEKVEPTGQGSAFFGVPSFKFGI